MFKFWWRFGARICTIPLLVVHYYFLVLLRCTTIVKIFDWVLVDFHFLNKNLFLYINKNSSFF